MTDLISNNNQSIKVGRRVCIGTYFGVVRYVGPIPGTESIWVGVEWDDSSRGKHNGIHNGVRYFNAMLV